jgi:hypothetical protein
VLDLVARQRLSTRAAAARLGLTAPQVEQRLNKALGKVDRELARLDWWWWPPW